MVSSTSRVIVRGPTCQFEIIFWSRRLTSNAYTTNEIQSVLIIQMCQNHSFVAVHTTCVQTGGHLDPSDQRRRRSNPLASILQDSEIHTFDGCIQGSLFPLR